MGRGLLTLMQHPHDENAKLGLLVKHRVAVMLEPEIARPRWGNSLSVSKAL
jgi:hypothetical protein